MKKFAILAAVAAAAIASPAMAQPTGAYAGAGYTAYETESGDLGAVNGRLGYQFNQYWGVEGEAAIGVQDDDNAELDGAYGIYGVGRVPVTSNLDVFGRVGYQKLEVDGSFPAADIDTDGVGYGAGVQYQLSPRFGIRGEYTRLEGDSETDTWGVGGVMSF